MATTTTTVTVHPERAEALWEYRDEWDFLSIDAALEEFLNRSDE